MRRMRSSALFLLLALLGAGVASPAEPQPRDDEAAFEFALGKLLAEEGKVRQALQHVERAVRQLPNEPVLRLEYARMLLRARQAERAIEEIDHARRLAPANPEVLAAVAKIHLARAAISPHSAAAAQSALEDLSRIPDADPQAMIWLAQLYLQQDMPARAAETLRELDVRLPGNRNIFGLLVEALIRSDQQDEAVRRLRAALRRDSADLQTRLTLAQLQEEAGRYAAAAATLAATPAAQRDDEDVRRRLAFALVRDGDLETARGHLRRLQDEGMASREDEFLYGVVLSLLGEAAQAEAVLRPLVDDEPLRHAWVIELSRILERRGRGGEAVRLLERSAAELRRDDRAPEAEILEAERLDALARMGAWPQVVDGLRGRLDQLPEAQRHRAALLLLEALRESERGGEALRLLRRGELSLPRVEREAEEVETLRRIGREEESFRLLARLEDSPDAESQFQAARLWLSWDDAPRAIPLLERVVATRAPREHEDLYWLATAYQQSDRRAEAEETLRRLLAADADFAPALNDLGYMLAEEGRELEEARRMTERAVRMEPDNGAYVDSLGWAHYQLGNLDEARQYLERAARLMPRDGTILEHLGDVYRAQGDQRSARRAYQRALELGEEDTAELERKLAALAESL